MEIIGKHNRAKVFNERIDDTTRAQIQTLVDQPFTKGASIRIMPDMHAGKGSVVGTTMTIHDKVVPNLVGVDLGCGMLCTEIKVKRIDFQRLDDVIRQYVPSGMNIRDTAHPYASELPLEDVRAPYKLDRALRSVGTLGSGNHFIEVNRDEAGRTFLVIHSGSRHLGVQIADHYQQLAVEHMMKTVDIRDEIERMKATGRQQDISAYLETEREARKRFRDLAYVEGETMEDYMHCGRQPSRHDRRHRRGDELERRRSIRYGPQLHRSRRDDASKRGHLGAGLRAGHHSDEHARRFAHLYWQGQPRLELLGTTRRRSRHVTLGRAKTRRLQRI